jgi:hypothetical protein
MRFSLRSASILGAFVLGGAFAPQETQAQWLGWENLGGITLEEPSCVSWGPNRIDCFARSTDAAMYHRWWNGSSWGGWENLGGVILEAPDCVSWGPNRIDCFARGTNQAMFHRWWNGSSWGGWENLGGVILDKPNCVSWGPNRIDCFARGTNAAMYHRWWNGASWGGWENLGGVILEEPNCVSWGPNRIDCFARGTNAAMFHRWWNGSNWGGWDSLGGEILDRPECVSWSEGRLDCFARGTNRALFHRWFNSVTSRPLTISRYNTATLTNAQADSLLADASSVLQTNDGDGDVACNVALVRSGNVTAFTNTDGSLDTSNELQTVFGLPGNVKVVNEVNFCANQFNTSFIGCGQTPGPSFIVERFTANQEGILWAHEFGHNQGLPHRDTTTNNVMFRSIGTNRQRVNQTECDSFVGSAGMTVAAVFETMPALAQEVEPPAMQLAMGEEAMGGMPGSDEDMPESADEALGMGEEGHADGGEGQQDVVTFVSQIYFDGLPLDEAAEFGSEDVETLIDMLNDPEQVLYHENIALTLGMIGDPTATEALIAYVEQGSGAGMEAPAATADDLARRAYKGRVGAIMGLGYLVHMADDDTALQYLIDSTAPAAWRERELEGMSTAPGTDGAEDLTKYAIFALGLSGNEEAREHLQSLVSGESDSLAAMGDDGADIVRQSLQINEEVSRDGLVEYYSDGE